MQIADLYIRVSTDEKALKGYSIRAQEELLYTYCEIRNIHIRRVVYEDHSAKNFNRPAWKQYLNFLKQNKRQSVSLLFLRWDRFSRNAGNAYEMIRVLKNLDVEPQAIDQPLDLLVPENKMMLAFYLAIPEVENDRRSQNVIIGMRRAMKEGKFMGLAPIGYVNITEPSGKKLIVPDQPQADIIRWAFHEIVNGELNTEQVFKMARSKGFSGTKSLFWFAIRNPVYCGRIFIPKYYNEDACIVKGAHEPLIHESLFDKVQDILDGRKRIRSLATMTAPPLMPLRGFLLCPICGKTVTASSSKGRNKYYTYYHCFDGCSWRIRTDVVNEALESNLGKYIMYSSMLEAYTQALSIAWRLRVTRLQTTVNSLLDKIKNQSDHLSFLRRLMLSNKISIEDFHTMKKECNSRIDCFELRLSRLASDETEIHDLLDTAANNSLRLKKMYKAGSIEVKRKIINSVYPDKLIYDQGLIRPIRINEVLQFIRLLNSELRKYRAIPTMWTNVVQSFQLRASKNFLPDLKRLANLVIDRKNQDYEESWNQSIH